jgi:hypothetical protein
MAGGVGDANGIGIVRGRIISLPADSAVGPAANSLGLQTCLTSSATISYLAPVRLAEKLRLAASAQSPVAAGQTFHDHSHRLVRCGGGCRTGNPGDHPSACTDGRLLTAHNCANRHPPLRAQASDGRE